MKNYIIVEQHITDFGWESEIIANYKTEELARLDLSARIEALINCDPHIAIRDLNPFNHSILVRTGWLHSSGLSYPMGQFLIVNLNRLDS